MALVDLREIEMPSSLAANYSLRIETLDAAGEKYAAVFSAPRTGNIRTIVFHTSTVAQDTNGLTVGLEGVDASGDPDGSAYGGSAAGTTAATSSNTIYTVTLGTDAAVTAGDMVAGVIEFTTFAASDDVDIQKQNASWHGGKARTAYLDVYTAAWAKAAFDGPVMAIGYDDGTYYPIAGLTVPNAYVRDTINTGTTPDEIALRFQLPMGTTCVGVWAHLDVDAADDFDFVLYSGEQGVDEVAEQTLSVDGNQVGSATGGNLYRYFAASETLAADTWYKIAVKPSTANSVFVYSVEPDAVAIMDALMLGQNAYFTSRTDGGSWTNDTSKRASIGILIDQIDVGGSSSMTSNRGMTGGING